MICDNDLKSVLKYIGKKHKIRLKSLDWNSLYYGLNSCSIRRLLNNNDYSESYDYALARYLSKLIKENNQDRLRRICAIFPRMCGIRIAQIQLYNNRITKIKKAIKPKDEKAWFEIIIAESRNYDDFINRSPILETELINNKRFFYQIREADFEIL